METNKMRCHFSIIFEKTGSFLVFWVILALNWIDDIIDVFTSPDFDITALRHILPICLGLVFLLFFIMGYQFLVWRKTFIYLDGDTFVIERNTLNRKKSTFVISSISNINLEQNLLERLIGTYRLKLDTESFSTSNSTDVSIVLSAPKAENLKKELLTLMKRDSASNTSDRADNEIIKTSENTKECYVSHASTSQVLSHCFFSISTFLLFFALAVMVGFPLLSHFADISFWDIISENDASFWGRFLAVLLLVITYGYSLIKQLFSFYHFCCFRQGNDLIIRYGFFRKQDFTIPLERINAIRIVQPPLARLTGRMQAQLICIGIGDSDTEKPQLTLCMKKEKFFAHLQELLPEFSTNSAREVHTLPKGSGITYFLTCLFFLVCFSAGFWIANLCMTDGDFMDVPLLVTYGTVFFFILLYQLLHYFSMGTRLDEKQLVIHNGAFQKQTWLIPYQKIQFVTFHQNPFCQLFGIVKGNVNILASLGNNVLWLPFMHRKDIPRLQQELLD